MSKAELMVGHLFAKLTRRGGHMPFQIEEEPNEPPPTA